MDTIEVMANQNSYCKSLESNRLRQIFTFGFIDGFKAADELSQRKLDAYAAFINGKITRSELDSILGIVTDNV